MFFMFNVLFLVLESLSEPCYMVLLMIQYDTKGEFNVDSNAE